MTSFWKDFSIKSSVKAFRYCLEAFIVKFGLWLFSRMTPKRASDVGSIISKFIGKKIAVNQLAKINLQRSLPELSQKDREKILNDMWDNLGRIVGEYVHIGNCPFDQICQFVEMSERSKKNIEEIKKSKKGGIIFSGHIGNWEIGPKVFLSNGLDVSTVYRPLNNPYVEEMTAKMRGVSLITKGGNGNRKIIEAIKANKFIVILADQKISEGEPIKFFNDEAITTTSISRIALKYEVPLIPARSIRIGKNFRFRVEVEKPLEFRKSKNINSDILKLTRQINLKLEEWIREYPAQWFWVHNRWKK